MNVMRISSNWIIELALNEGLIFRSNLDGRHCNGAAKYASLGIMYFTDSNEKIINMRENWFLDLNIVLEKAKSSLRINQ